MVLEVAGQRGHLPSGLGVRQAQCGGDGGGPYDRPQPPLPDMYGKNLTFKTGGVDGCNCAQTLDLIAAGKLDTTPSSPTPTLSRTSTRPTSSSSPGGRASSRWPSSP